MCTRLLDESEAALLILGHAITGKTGDLVRATGVYRSVCGFEKTLPTGDLFPACFGQPTVWGLLDGTA